MTDQELDDALAALHADVGMSTGAQAGARGALLTAIDASAGHPTSRGPAVPVPMRPPRFGGPARWIAAAAAVAVLVGGGLAVQASGPATPGASAEAVALLSRSAAVIPVQDDVPVGPGQYRVVTTHSWGTSSLQTEDRTEHRWLSEQVATQWVPFDAAGVWQLTSTYTGNLRWITDERAGRAAGAGLHYGWKGQPEGTAEPFTEILRAPRGEFYGPPAEDSWWPSTAESIAELPRDPDALYRRMAQGLAWTEPVDGRGNAALIRFPADLLRTGLVPADLRAAFYEALTRVPGLQVTDDAADLDGRRGVAFGLTGLGGETQELIIDPATGEYLGERQINQDGSLYAYTAVTVGVADELGAEPAG